MKTIKIGTKISWNDKPKFFDPDIKELTYYEFIEFCITNTQLFGQGAKNVRSGIRILDSLESAIKNAATEFCVETEDWQKLWDALNNKQLPPRMAQAVERENWYENIEKAEDLKSK